MSATVESAGAISPDAIGLQRLPIKLESDDRRVITLPFTLGGEVRARAIIERVNRLSDAEVETILNQVFEGFRSRHLDLIRVFEDHFKLVAKLAEHLDSVSRNRRWLIGSYLTMEYAIESVALFNPSIVPHPNQDGVAPGAVRFIMSLRATGEGHLSSIVFRSGTLGIDHEVNLDPLPPYFSRAQLAPNQYYVKMLFQRKLAEMAVNMELVTAVLEPLPDRFTFLQLERRLEEITVAEHSPLRFAETMEGILWLARSNYQLQLPKEADISDVVIYPQTDNESRGVEDVRLVRFVDDDGSVTYYGAYTAYNGFQIMPMMLDTEDFRQIACRTLNGACAQNKGMALFPRRIAGRYVMCSRIDGQNLYIMRSDNVHFWDEAELLAEPVFPWELMLMGNCGSPLETPEGWLLLTHGVGPMRRYCIGAMLLDLEDPLKIIGRLAEPILVPSEDEREGYVPNVVYSCGSMVHRDQLYVAYAMSDIAASIATIPMDTLIDRLLNR